MADPIFGGLHGQISGTIPAGFSPVTVELPLSGDIPVGSSLFCYFGGMTGTVVSQLIPAITDDMGNTWAVDNNAIQAVHNLPAAPSKLLITLNPGGNSVRYVAAAWSALNINPLVANRTSTAAPETVCTDPATLLSTANFSLSHSILGINPAAGDRIFTCGVFQWDSVFGPAFDFRPLFLTTAPGWAADKCRSGYLELANPSSGAAAGNVSACIGYRIFSRFDAGEEGNAILAGYQNPRLAGSSLFPSRGYLSSFGYGVSAGPTRVPGTGPWNLETRHGGYEVAVTLTASGQSHIRYARAKHSIPPFELNVRITTPGVGVNDSEPRMIRDRRAARIVLFRRQSGAADDVLETVSHDDGKSWSDPISMFTSSTHPTIAVDPRSGLIIRAAYSGGKIKANRQYPGEAAPGTEFFLKNHLGADIAVADDTFHLQPEALGSKRWLLAARKSGETSITSFQSWDDAASFREIT